jgi:tRNA threonylcarbamoyladenosine biosynthesis protein TsaE
MQRNNPLITVTNLDSLEKTAQALINYGFSYKIWLFTGELGAGKTTLIKAICKQLGVLEHVSSPTFSLINTYQLASGGVVYHLDAYRLKNEAEAVDMDYPYYFETGTYCFIEWPDKIAQLIPIPHIHIKLNFNGDTSRELYAEKVDRLV